MYLFTVPESIHTLVLYGFVSVYVLMILAADICLSVPGKAWDLLRRFGLNAVAVSLACVVVSNIYVANAASLAPVSPAGKYPRLLHRLGG